jgi:hypothetical protein
LAGDANADAKVDAKEASQQIEAGFDYVTGGYDDCGKLFRERK